MKYKGIEITEFGTPDGNRYAVHFGEPAFIAASLEAAKTLVDNHKKGAKRHAPALQRKEVSNLPGPAGRNKKGTSNLGRLPR